ncbi:MAG: hypothetical protein JXA78_06795 [Anaerolineales bacterium]|nr:hypothetical protein [Anaerolineales bacterium]
MYKVLIVLTALLVAMGTAGGVLVGVANAAAPGDALYGLDRGVESLRLRLTSNPTSVQELQEQFAQERLDEVQSLAERGDQQRLEQALQELGEALLASTGASQAPQTTPEVEVEEPDEDLGAFCDGSAAKNHPVGEKLAERFGVDYQEIMDWACAGYGFGNIKLAYEISQASGAPVSEVFEKFASGQGWGEVAQGYGLKSAAGAGDDDGDDGDSDGPKQPNQGAYCNGTAENNHPAGEKLAETFGVGYDEIMGWFCQGYGFGEIKLAYTIAGTGAATVEELFAERANGKGWGAIMKDHNFIGKDKPPKVKTNNGQGKSQGKGKGLDKDKKP